MVPFRRDVPSVPEYDETADVRVVAGDEALLWPTFAAVTTTPYRTQVVRMQRAGATGLEPATSGVTGRRSNRLNYAPAWRARRS